MITITREFYQDFLDRCVAARKARGLSQAKLARLLRTHQSVISKFENGQTNPTVGFLFDYSQAVGRKLTVRLDKLK